jgi:hypothetical protein
MNHFKQAALYLLIMILVTYIVLENIFTVKKIKLEILMHLHTFNTPEYKNVVAGVQYDVCVTQQLGRFHSYLIFKNLSIIHL